MGKVANVFSSLNNVKFNKIALQIFTKNNINPQLKAKKIPCGLFWGILRWYMYVCREPSGNIIGILLWKDSKWDAAESHIFLEML